MKNWNKTFIEIAEKFAEHSTCIKRKVGAVLVKNLRILATGYNGTPTGFVNCDEVFHHNSSEANLKGILYHRKKDHEDLSSCEIISHHEFSERYEIHAEQNCLSFAAKNGVSTNRCTLYVTTAPCVHCAKIIIASGISRVVYKEVYKNDFGLQLLKEAGIQVDCIENTSDNDENVWIRNDEIQSIEYEREGKKKSISKEEYDSFVKEREI